MISQIRNPRTTVFRTFLLAILPTLILATPARACSCIAPGSPHEELQRSDLVFVGRVLDIDRVDAGGDGHSAYLRVRFENIRTIGTGDDSRRVTIRTATHSAACGFYFEKGAHYVVYAHEYEGVLTTSICSRTAHVDNAHEDLEAFVAEDLKSLGDASPRCGGLTGTAAIQSALLVVGFVLLQRRKREGLYLPACRGQNE